MKVTDIVQSKKITFSFEIFPPKKGEELSGAKNIISELSGLHPDFISVTYGSSGDNKENTINLAREVQTVNKVTALAHMTCLTSTKNQVKQVLDELSKNHIQNILALRGDAVTGVTAYSDYNHASDLVTDIKKYGDFCVGGACYPEGHPEANGIENDIANIKKKVDSGCDFLTTQMFFDNNILYNYMYKLLRNDINIPVFAGIMPITNIKQINRINAINGTALPQKFKAIMEKFQDDPKALSQAGIAYATNQIIDLIANGVNNIHLYTMNKPEIAEKIVGNLSYILK